LKKCGQDIVDRTILENKNEELLKDLEKRCCESLENAKSTHTDLPKMEIEKCGQDRQNNLGKQKISLLGLDKK
jgi:hypothetical protein